MSDLNSTFDCLDFFDFPGRKTEWNQGGLIVIKRWEIEAGLRT
jgi:hypothetical protein